VALDIQQHHIRPQPPRRRHRRGPIRGVAHHGKPLRLQQRPRRLTETVMVIDDQHSRAHAPIVANTIPARTVASTNPRDPISVQARTQDCGQPRFARALPPLALPDETIYPPSAEGPMRKLQAFA
jgi:hypothetical protein